MMKKHKKRRVGRVKGVSLKGHVRERTVGGATRYVVDWIDPLSGNRTRRAFADKDEATKLQEQVNETAKSARHLRPVADPDVTLEAFAADHCATQVATGAWNRPGTINAYREHYHRISRFDLGAQHLLGQVRVRDLARWHAEALATGMRQDGFAPRTTAMAYRLFSRLLDRAVSRGLLPHHPVDRHFFTTVLRPLFRAPKDERVKAFTAPQAQRFLAVAREHSRLADLYAVGFTSGCRLGELLALQLEDDLTSLVDGHRARQLQVARTLVRTAGTVRPVTGPTKSGKTRPVDVGADLGRVLDRIAAERPRLALRHGWRPVPPWLFLTRAGRPLDQSRVRADFARVCRLAGLADCGFTPHAMRHTFASLHIVAGRNAKWVQQQLGHAKIGITLDLYADWFTLSDARAADALGAALLGENGTGNGTALGS
jgi:integrase